MSRYGSSVSEASPGPGELATDVAESTPLPQKIHLAIIGDSTVADYRGEQRPIHGWGQLLRDLLDPACVEISNLALGGRSSKSFFAEANWHRYLSISPAPDYLLLQFGHNDLLNADKGSHRETTPAEVPDPLPAEGLGSRHRDYYRFNLAEYVSAARARGTTPVIVTPMERYILTEGRLERRNEPYAKAALAVARQLGVPSIDLNSFSADYFASCSSEDAQALHINREDGRLDPSHHTRRGAHLWASTILQRLQEHYPRLKPLLIAKCGDGLDL